MTTPNITLNDTTHTLNDTVNSNITITCTVGSSNAEQQQMLALVAGLISLVVGSAGGSLVTHRMMNSTCIKSANVSGDHASIVINANDLEQAAAKESSSLSTKIIQFLQGAKCCKKAG